MKNLTLMRLSQFIFIVVVFAISTNARALDNSSSLDDFLRENATKVEEKIIHKSIRFFLDTHFNRRTEQVIWLDGSLRTVQGEFYENLKMKFNTITNTIYIKNGASIYRIVSYQIESFTIMDEKKEKTFQHGYALKHQNSINAYCDISATRVMKMLINFERFDQIVIDELVSSQAKNLLTLKINTFDRELIYELGKYLGNHVGIDDVKIESDELTVHENTFMEVLFENKKFLLLKHNFKNVSQNKSTSIVTSHEQNFVFEKNYYYLSNANNVILQMFFTESSIKELFAFAGVTGLSNIPILKNNPSQRNEDKLVNWLGVSFN